MIEKSKVLKQMSCEEDKIMVSRLYDLAKSAGKGWRASGFFLDPAKCNWINQWFSDCQPVLWGGYEGAERRMVSFGDSDANGDWFPISALLIQPSILWDVSHRDVLGAVMALGIDRAKTGDILVTEEQAVLFCEDRLAPFLIEQLCSIGRYSVEVTIAPPEEIKIPQKSTQEVTDTVASLRADAILAAMYSLPRAKAQQAILSGRVMVNWEELTSQNQELKEGDMVSLRGLGRCELTKIGGLSRKGRIYIHARRFL